MKIFSFLFILSLLFLSGCHSSPVQEEKGLFQYKASYVGDNGAVGQITRRLPNPDGEHISGLEVQTKKEPYGITLNYINV
ncbi:DUF4825 domain-containing protein [uncultured Rossellomorea sp.]|uniref:DUF4825 domain-containing protein n=1 Tax=uncultured Rossellomorea sp. TaxID=2837549 RepID=UPI0026110ADC|nr:DUF4825 domain-containing protein [uncultured Rossellomorea sp.]